MSVLKTETYFSNALPALENPLLMEKYREVLSVLQDAKTPVFKEKSSLQKGLDLVHPVLNVVVDEWFTMLGWTRQAVISKLTDGAIADNGSIDFVYKLPDGRYIALEIQFGNGGRLERDYSKFQALKSQGLLALSIIAYFDRATAVTADSGLAIFETAVKRTRMHGDLPLCIISVSREDTPEVDLASLKGIVFPSVLGGSGTEKGPLLDCLLDALLNEKDLSTVRLPHRARAVVRRHAVEHVRKLIEGFELDIGRALNASDRRLRQVLTTLLANFFRNSYGKAAYRPLFKEGARAVAREQLARDAAADEPQGQPPTPIPAPSPAAAKPAPAAPARIPAFVPVFESAPALAAQVATEPARHSSTLPWTGGRRVPRAQVHAPVRPTRFTPNPAANKRFPVDHFAVAGAMAEAMRRHEGAPLFAAWPIA